MQLLATWSGNTKVPLAVIVVGSDELFKCLIQAQAARSVEFDDCKARLLFGDCGDKLAHAVLGKEVAPCPRTGSNTGLAIGDGKSRVSVAAWLLEQKISMVDVRSM
jgi:hypothetical protein